MIRQLALLSVLMLFGVWLVQPAAAETFELNNGSQLTGEPVAFDAKGLIVRTPEQTYSPKTAWTNFTVSALKKLSKIPRAKPYVDPLLELELEEEAPEEAEVEIKPKPVERLERPSPDAGIGAIFSSGISVTIFILLYLANIYAGYEVSIFRNYPPYVVCPIAAIAPVVGPILFLCLPTRMQVSPEEYLAPQEELPPPDFTVAQPEAEQPDEAAAAAHAAMPTLPPPTVYQRGHTTFNRRFFETKLAGFLRLVPAEPEKDMVVAIKSVRGDHVGKRIARVAPAELYLQVEKAGASSEVMIPFTDITEVQIRHKDAEPA